MRGSALESPLLPPIHLDTWQPALVPCSWSLPVTFSSAGVVLSARGRRATNRRAVTKASPRLIGVSTTVRGPGIGRCLEKEDPMNMPEMGTRVAALHTPGGIALLRDPLLNKGTAFTEQERDALGLRGLLPAHVLSLEQQAEGGVGNMGRLAKDLEKYGALNGS